MSEKPKKLKRCVAHRHGCDCREKKYAEMDAALKIIEIWALTRLEEDQHRVMIDIAVKATAALNCMEGKYERA
jgi:hypothetical protein